MGSQYEFLSSVWKQEHPAAGKILRQGHRGQTHGRKVFKPDLYRRMPPHQLVMAGPLQAVRSFESLLSMKHIGDDDAS
jgi:hypothetical protein